MSKNNVVNVQGLGLFLSGVIALLSGIVFLLS